MSPKHHAFISLLILLVNCNWTEWSKIQREIARVISKSDEREARGRLKLRAWILSEFYDTMTNY